MPYIDSVGKYITFERKAGEDITDPEHMKVTCPGCSKQAEGKSQCRSLYNFADTYCWVVLPAHGQYKYDELYCSYDCALKHNPNKCEAYRNHLNKSVTSIQNELRNWYTTNSPQVMEE